jgi:phospholipid/cholesterol/gamma-HCH transport system substrate-binding protein
MTETGTRIAANAEKISAEGITISKNVVILSEKANELAEEARIVLKKLQDFFNKVPSTGGLKGVEAGMDLIRETTPNHWRTDMNAKIPIGGGSNLHVGVWDAFESNRFTLQLGKPYMSTNEYRYGIYASKPGVGVDFQLSRNLKLKGDLYDINDPRLDLGVRYEFKDGLLGWLGFNQVFDKNAFYVGLGFRR